MNVNNVPIHIKPGDPNLTTIQARFAGESSWVHFRAPVPYHEWNEVPSHASMIHDMLEGWHACILHTGDTFTILERHPDYYRVATYIRMMDKARYPFYKDGRIVA